MKFFKFLLFLYVLACAVLYFVQDRFIFNPEHIPEDYTYRMGTEIEIPLEEDLSLNALLVQDSEGRKSEGVILYLHGNRGSIRFGIYQIRTMLNKGYDILIPDYRSYGKTEGNIGSEKKLYSDVQKVYDYLKSKYDEEKIMIVGYSLGTGMASYLARFNNPFHLVLVAPFTSLTDIKNKYAWFIPNFLLKFKLPVKKFLKNVSCPVTILHGTDDRIVDYNFSKKLKTRFPEKVDLITVRNEGHRGIIFDSELENALYNILVQ